MHGGARLARHPDGIGLIDEQPAAAGPAPAAATTTRLDLLAIGAVLVAFVATGIAVVARSRGYMPVGDWALTELRVRDVGRHPVVAGLYSRDGWSHPGPMMFYVLAPLYRLFGSRSIATDVGALVLNGASVVGMAIVVRRRAGAPLLLCTLLCTALLIRTLGSGFVADPWNPFVTVLPFALLVVLVWSMACGDAWALPVGVATATFLAQTHVGFVVLALPLLAVGAIWLLFTRARAWRSLRWPVVCAVAIGIVLWLPVLVDALNGAPDNLARVVDWFRRGHDTHSLLQGVRMVSGQLGGLPEWLVTKRTPVVFTGEPAFLYRAPFPWVLLVVAVAAAVFARRRVTDGVRLVAVLGCGCVVGVLAVMRTVGLAYDYRLRWTWVLGMLAAVVVAWAATVALDRRRDVVLVVVGIGLAIACVADVGAAVDARPARSADSRVLEAVVPDVLGALRGVRGPVVIDDGNELSSDYSRGLLLQLERHGVDARMRRRDRAVVGDHRVIDPRRAVRRLVVARDDAIAARDAEPGLRRIAAWTSVTAAELQAYRAAAARLDRLVDGGELEPFERALRLRSIDLGRKDPAFAWAVAVYIAS